MIRQLPSFREWIHSLTLEQTTLLQNDEALRNHLPALLDYLQSYCQNYRIAFNMLMERLKSSSPHPPPSWKIYAQGLETPLFESEIYHRLSLSDDVMDHYFRRHLVCYRWVPLNELVFLNHVTILKQAFHPSFSTSLHMALTQPWTLLKDDNTVLLPDICIAYALYRECGSMINLCDWYTAFVARLEAPNSYARFLRVVGELQFLGLIRPTRRRTDHVLRLYWQNDPTPSPSFF
jgi:hypothetical protein